MKELSLLGTSHDIQRGERLSSQFKTLLLDEIKNNNFACIAEEIDYAKSYVAENICKNAGIPHLIVEPSPEEAKKLGIESHNEIIFRIQNVFFDEFEEIGDWPSNPSACNLPEKIWIAYSEAIESSYRAREREWYERISKKDTWPLLFICGANHITPFENLLKSSGIIVRKLFGHWDLERN